MRICSVIGARPQFVKAAMLSHALSSTHGVEEILIHTGQHYDANMSDTFFSQLDIPPPKYNLGIGSGTHGDQTGRMLTAIEKVLLDERPDMVIVYGDTNSTLAAALAAAKLNIPVAHIEAGLRSFNRVMPEEINRVLTDHASELLFAPTTTSVENLRHEGIPESKISLVGDVMYDAALFYGDKARRKSNILEMQRLEPHRYVLATVHRAENTEDQDRLYAIFNGLSYIASTLPVIVPLHPRTRKILDQNGLLNRLGKSIRVIEPVGYLDMIQLEQNAALIATDSGGVQKEAFFYKVPCVTLRGETEWVELVELGWNRIVPPVSAADISRSILDSIGSRGLEGTPYGDGNAAQLIVRIVRDYAC